MDKATFQYYSASYGSLKNWPSERLDDAMRSLQANPEWQSILDLEVQFEQQLDEYDASSPNLERLEQDILSQLFEQATHQTTGQPTSQLSGQNSTLDVLLEWLMPSRSLWRPALAACLPILIGISVGGGIEVEEQYLLSEEMELVTLESNLLESSYLENSYQLTNGNSNNES